MYFIPNTEDSLLNRKDGWIPAVFAPNSGPTIYTTTIEGRQFTWMDRTERILMDDVGIVAIFQKDTSFCMTLSPEDFAAQKIEFVSASIVGKSSTIHKEQLIFRDKEFQFRDQALQFEYSGYRNTLLVPSVPKAPAPPLWFQGTTEHQIIQQREKIHMTGPTTKIAPLQLQKTHSFSRTFLSQKTPADTTTAPVHLGAVEKETIKDRPAVVRITSMPGIDKSVAVDLQSEHRDKWLLIREGEGVVGATRHDHENAYGTLFDVGLEPGFGQLPKQHDLMETKEKKAKDVSQEEVTKGKLPEAEKPQEYFFWPRPTRP
ncbi:hypothetical protein C8R43DRAFT_954635 [Mycena crocata]|nr:hypothetical protein C8R43DRAFT_954635 [Mycena crocata]